MMCRLWRGWTTRANADAYERTVRGDVIPGIEARRIAGFRSIDLLRREVSGKDLVEFTTLMWFDSLDAVKTFTGEDYEVAHVPASARAVLSSFDERAVHFELLDRRPQTKAFAIDRVGVELDASSALLVIDVQQGFLDPDWGERNNPDAEIKIGALIAAWRERGWPVHHVHHASPSPLGKFRVGTVGHRPKAEAVPRRREPVHVKTVNSGFIGTTLEAGLRREGVTRVVIVGLTTNHCVSTTARMAGNLGFQTFVASDACAAFARPGLDGRMRSAEAVHNDALSDLNDEFAFVVTTGAVLDALRVDGSSSLSQEGAAPSAPGTACTLSGPTA